uniref:Uncharacterized protein n=1 Tax=Rhizophora mucronata TaxID=61149 RepID=A0A2P2LY15_RHIMU
MSGRAGNSASDRKSPKAKKTVKIPHGTLGSILNCRLVDHFQGPFTLRAAKQWAYDTEHLRLIFLKFCSHFFSASFASFFFFFLN